MGQSSVTPQLVSEILYIYTHTYTHTHIINILHIFIFYIYLHLFNPQLRICLLTFEREGEREKYQCDRQISISCLPYVPQLGTEPTTFWYTGQCSNQLSHLARAEIIFKDYPLPRPAHRCPCKSKVQLKE